MNPYVLDIIEHLRLKKLEVVIYYTAEMDEFWSLRAAQVSDANLINDGHGTLWTKTRVSFWLGIMEAEPTLTFGNC